MKFLPNSALAPTDTGGMSESHLYNKPGNLMTNVWLRKRCTTCPGFVLYLSNWSAQPRQCIRCRLAAIINLPALFKAFLENEDKLNYKITLPDDRHAYNQRSQLREKVIHALKNTSVSTDLFIELCAKDRELYRLAFKLAREDRFESTSQKTGRTTSNKLIKQKRRGYIWAVSGGGGPGTSRRK